MMNQWLTIAGEREISRGNQSGRKVGGAVATPAHLAPLVRECVTPTGTRVCFSTLGDGPPVLVLPGWASHVTLDWSNSRLGAFYRILAQRRRVVFLDPPGMGLPATATTGLTIDAQVECVLAVLAATGCAQLSIVASSVGGPLAIALAARYPQRVNQLVLLSTGPRFVASEEDPDGIDPELLHAVESLIRADWQLGSRAIAEILLPHASASFITWYADLQRLTTRAHDAARMLSVLGSVDLRDEVARVRAPTLVLHRLDATFPSLAVAQRMAAAIPNATLQVLPGHINLPLVVDPEDTAKRVISFVAPAESLLTPRELAVLEKLSNGLSNRAIARTLGISEHTVARHLANVFRKFAVNNRGAAIAQAHRLGVAS